MKNHRAFICLLAGLGLTFASFAQPPAAPLGEARSFVLNREYDKAAAIFKRLYAEAPFDRNIYQEYLQTLDSAHRYEEALALTDYMANIRRDDPTVLVDKGTVYRLKGESKNARNSFDEAIARLNGFEMQVRELASAFDRAEQPEYAVNTYLQGRKLSRQPFAYSTELAILYGKQGQTENAINALLDVAQSQTGNMDQVQSGLLQTIGDDPRKNTLAQKAIEKRMKGNPGNPYWGELLTWMYTNKGQYSEALEKITQIDKTNREDGTRLLSFIAAAMNAGRDTIALQGLTYLAGKPDEGTDKASVYTAIANLYYKMLSQKMPPDTNLIHQFLAACDSVEKRDGRFSHYPLTRKKGAVLALYAGRADDAIHEMTALTDSARLNNDELSYAKLDLGDYNVITGKVWNAALLYAQVDKANKENDIGEDARFRNARLSYYRGDFRWAQDQLKVLKASTSELIANDALNLSVMITENAPSDSNWTALKSFADADLLLFQHKTGDAYRILDSLKNDNPQSPLQDDILMAQARAQESEGKYPEAAALLEQLVQHYGEDVLADDALMKLGDLYTRYLNNNNRAIACYERILTEYPSSTFVGQARILYNQLKKNTAS